LKNRPANIKTIRNLLVWALICVCLGRAYQCIFWDIPIRSLIWNEDLFTRLIKTLFDLDWNEYLNYTNTSGIINAFVSGIGWSLLIALLLVLLTRKLKSFSLSWISIILTFIAILYHLEKFRTAGQFFEYSLQFMTPLLFLFFLKCEINPRWQLLVKICIALTFTSHGLYALGFYPVPGNFVAMTIKILHVSNDTAILLLQTVGIVDVFASIGLFFKGKVFTWSIWYCMVWGALTALARIVANIDIDWILPSLHQWAYEAIYRVPHFMVPIALWMASKNDLSSTEKES